MIACRRTKASLASEAAPAPHSKCPMLDLKLVVRRLGLTASERLQTQDFYSPKSKNRLHSAAVLFAARKQVATAGLHLHPTAAHRPTHGNNLNRIAQGRARAMGFGVHSIKGTQACMVVTPFTPLCTDRQLTGYHADCHDDGLHPAMPMLSRWSGRPGSAQ